MQVILNYGLLSVSAKCEELQFSKEPYFNQNVYNFRSRRGGSSFLGLPMLDPLLSPPSTFAEIC